jgi:hypothetical protein
MIQVKGIGGNFRQAGRQHPAAVHGVDIAATLRERGY